MTMYIHNEYMSEVIIRITKKYIGGVVDMQISAPSNDAGGEAFQERANAIPSVFKSVCRNDTYTRIWNTHYTPMGIHGE